MFKDLDEAIEALKYRTYDFVRQQAAEELSKSDDPRAIEALIHSIENDISWVVRAASIDALVKIGNDTAIPTILKAIDNELVGVQYQAVKAFQHFKDKSAIPKIVKNLKNSKHIHFRKLAAETLEILGWSSEDPLEKAIITASKGVWDHTILKERDEEIVLDLIKMYVEDEHFWEMYYESETYFDETEIYPAVSYLGKIKGKESYNLFIKVFDKLESYDQRYLVSNFSSIGTKKDIPRLMEYIEKVILDDDELWDSKAGVDAIKEILADESEAFFKQEIDSRIRTSDRTEQFLIRVFLQGLDPESESTKDYLKKYLIQGPSFVKESILYRLIDEREERDVSVLSLLLEQLQRGEESLQVSKAMLIVLRISKDEKLIEPFLELLSKASLELKKEIVLTLGYFEDKRVIQVLQDYLHHKDKELVKWVCLSLIYIH